MPFGVTLPDRSSGPLSVTQVAELGVTLPEFLTLDAPVSAGGSKRAPGC